MAKGVFSIDLGECYILPDTNASKSPPDCYDKGQFMKASSPNFLSFVKKKPMLDQLIKLVEQNAGEAIVKNQAIPNQHNDAAIQEVAGQIFSGLKGQVAQGNMDQVVSMFQGGSTSSLTNNPMIAQMISSVAGNFAAKFGIPQDTARNIVSSLIPTVMSQLVKKTNDPNDSSFDLSQMVQSMGGNNMDLAGMLGKLGGSNTGGLGGALGGLFGKG